MLALVEARLFVEMAAGALFMSAALHKVIRPALPLMALERLRVPSPQAAMRVVIVLELCLGISLASGWNSTPALMVAFATLLVFTGALIGLRLRGHQTECGCGVGRLPFVPPELRNAILAAGIAIAGVAPRANVGGALQPANRLIIVAACVLALHALLWLRNLIATEQLVRQWKV